MTVTDQDTDGTDPAVWRGVAAEDAEAMTGAVADLLRSRSRRLAADLFGPHRRALAMLGVIIVVTRSPCWPCPGWWITASTMPSPP